MSFLKDFQCKIGIKPTKVSQGGRIIIGWDIPVSRDEMKFHGFCIGLVDSACTAARHRGAL